MLVLLEESSLKELKEKKIVEDELKGKVSEKLGSIREIAGRKLNFPQLWEK